MTYDNNLELRPALRGAGLSEATTRVIKAFESDDSQGDLASYLHDHHIPVLESIKAVMQVKGVSLSEAKRMVLNHPDWSKEAGEVGAFQDKVIQAIERI